MFFSYCSFIACVGSLHQHTSDKNWRNRRSQKLDKMELLNLQSSLQSEIQAKAAISEELSRTRADLIAAQKYAQLKRHSNDFFLSPMFRRMLMFVTNTMKSFYRDLRETRQKWDSVGSEIKRKDNQIRELQQRLEVNEGCKCCNSISITFIGLGTFLSF